MTDDAQLVLIRGPRTGETVRLHGDTVTLGRDPRNDVVIDHPQVSRHHARIAREERTWIIEDLDSTNGTFVNGAHLSQPRALTRGDVIELGEAVALVYRYEVVPEEAGRPAQVPPPPSRPPRDQPPERMHPPKQTRLVEQTYPPQGVEAPQRVQPGRWTEAERQVEAKRRTEAERQTPPGKPAERFHSRTSSTPAPSYRREEAQPNRTWLWVGLGCLVLLLIVACASVFVLDALGVLPAFFYDPLRWMGLI